MAKLGDGSAPSGLFQELRTWLLGLSDAQSLELFTGNTYARGKIQVPGGAARPDRKRVALAVSLWARRATDQQLRALARAALAPTIDGILASPAYTEDECKDPSPSTLREMLLPFGPVVAALATVGMVVEDIPAAASARAVLPEVWGWTQEPPPAPAVAGERTPAAIEPPPAPGPSGEVDTAVSTSPPHHVDDRTGGDAPHDEVAVARALAAAVESGLERARAAVRAGRRIPDLPSLLVETTAYEDAVLAALDAAAAVDPSITVHDDLTACEEAQDRHRVRQEQTRERARGLMGSLELKRTMLRAFQTQVLDQPATGTYLHEPILVLLKEIDDLQAELEALDSSPAPVSGPTTPSPPPAGATEAVPLRELATEPEPPAQGGATSSAADVVLDDEQRAETASAGKTSPRQSPASSGGAAAPSVAQPAAAEAAAQDRALTPLPARPDEPPSTPTTTSEPDTPDATSANDVQASPVLDDDDHEAHLADGELGALVLAGRLDEAYWLARTHGAPPARHQALRLLAASFASSPDEATDEMPVLLPAELAGLVDPTSAALTRTALLHSALLLGREPVALSQLQPLSGEVLSTAGTQLLEAAETAARQHCKLPNPTQSLDDASDTGPSISPADELAELAEQVSRRFEEKPRRKLMAARATWVLQDLYAPEGALRRALEHVLPLATDPGSVDREALRAFVDEYQNHAKAEALIQERTAAVVEGRRSFERLHSRALETLLREVAEAVRIAATALELSASRMNGDGGAAAGAQVRRLALVVHEQTPDPSSLASAAVHRLAGRILHPDAPAKVPVRSPGSGSDPDDVLLLSPSFPRDASRTPLADAPGAADAVQALESEGSETEAVVHRSVSAHVAVGALDLATATIKAFGTAEDSRRAPVLEEGRTLWRERLRQTRVKAADLLAQLRAQNLLDESDTAELAGALEAPPEEDDRWDQQVAALESVADYLAAVQEQRLEELSALLHGLANVSTEDRRRVDGALEDHDTATAAEMIALLENGEDLETASGDDGGDLEQFVAFVSDQTADRQEPPPTVAELVAAAQEAVGLHHSVDATSAITAFEKLTSPRQSEEQRTHVASVLLALGLDAKQTVRPLNASLRPPRGVFLFEVRPTQMESSYVAELGSRSGGTFRIVVLSDDQTKRNVLEHVDDAAVGTPHVVVYLRPMTMAMRAKVHRESHRRGLNAIVVDACAFAWVVASAPRSYRALQRVTLPWAGYTPYTPYVSGVVAPEVFKGRDRERSTVMSPDGGTFVFGGRQLGKSALLSNVRDDFTAVPGQLAIMLDLKALGLGESEKPSQLWRQLAFELESRQVLARGRASRATPETVQQSIRTWLDGDPSRRLLLLLDEADSFLNADSRGKEGAGGAAIFPTVNHLKSLVESTQRRFRVVYAGLHQVQRFSHLPNVLTVHGGPDVPIGPLEPSSAVSLVRDPMTALGYRFESARLVWHLLAFTNYQASLVQIVCAELLKVLRDDPRASAAQRPVMITERHVEAVLSNAVVRQRVAERLRITINLEDHYRVLVLVLALRALDDGYHARYSPSTILDEAQLAWPEGFEGVKDEALETYLDELVGLGVLVKRRDGDYSVRSPNVVSMLGTREELEAELDAADFTFAYEYNTLMARRTVPAGRTGTARSPLTEAQLAGVFTRAMAGEVPVVCASPLAAPEHFAPAIASVAHGAEVEVRFDQVDDDPSCLSVLDLRDHVATVVAERWARLRAEGSRAVLVVTPAAVASLPREAAADLVVARRWSQQSLRSWTESPVERPVLRERLVRATGGWPLLVERALTAIHGGRAIDDVLTTNESVPRDGDEARRLLTAIGVDEPLAAVLSPWAEAVDIGDVLRVEDVAAVCDDGGVPAAELLTLLRRSDLVDESPGGFALEPLTHRCLLASTK